MPHHPSAPRKTETLILVLGRRLTRYRLSINGALAELRPRSCEGCAKAAEILKGLDRPDDDPKKEP